jgi:hypothetical protein
MGFEYQAKTRLDDAQARRLIDGLSKKAGWKLVQSLDRCASFSFADTPAGGDFKEDFFVEVNADGSIYVVFHAASREQEQATFAAIKRALHRLGVIGPQFEEL